MRIVTLAEGEISELHVGLKGTMNQLFLKDLADKTRRGLRGRVKAGRSGGGRCFGYDVDRSIAPDGTPTTGKRAINSIEAAVVERIFKDYVAGCSPRAIAAILNAEGVTGPHSGTWSASTIHGNPRRGTGILNNELYVGRLVWNRLRYVKDPETGKRVSRPNSEDAVIITDVSDLRIIDDQRWKAAKARQAEAAMTQMGNRGAALGEVRRARYLLSGLVTCGVCGGSMSVLSATHVGCSAARNKGPCANRKTIALSELERRVLGALGKRLMDPTLFGVFCEEFTNETNRLRAEARAALADEERQPAKTKRDLVRASTARSPPLGAGWSRKCRWLRGHATSVACSGPPADCCPRALPLAAELGPLASKLGGPTHGTRPAPQHQIHDERCHRWKRP